MHKILQYINPYFVSNNHIIKIFDYVTWQLHSPPLCETIPIRFVHIKTTGQLFPSAMRFTFISMHLQKWVLYMARVKTFIISTIPIDRHHKSKLLEYRKSLWVFFTKLLTHGLTLTPPEYGESLDTLFWCHHKEGKEANCSNFLWQQKSFSTLEKLFELSLPVKLSKTKF